ncbi:HvfC/BufC N-terminal domain-containing protein [Vibrio sp. M260118]|uniref:HvfC/BufC N-terminal domain-containing protein n=1 Tax=Vibrio sp. M260118 TaxID=3020896 RepID=UPI002F419B34
MSASPSLADLQHTFAQALHYQATGEECNISNDNFSADERMQIYRNNFIISLSDVLQATYPMLNALWGEECFEQIARQHVLDYPLEAGDVSHYGEHFDTTIERFPAVIEAAPYSLEVARYEWHIDLAQQQSNQISLADALLPLAHLAQVPVAQQPQIQLHLKPGVMAFQSPYALFSLQQAINSNNFEGLNLEQAQQGLIASSLESEVWTLALDTDPYQLLSFLQSGCMLTEIPPELLTHLEILTQHDLLAGFSLATLEG